MYTQHNALLYQMELRVYTHVLVYILCVRNGSMNEELCYLLAVKELVKVFVVVIVVAVVSMVTRYNLHFNKICFTRRHSMKTAKIVFISIVHEYFVIHLFFFCCFTTKNNNNNNKLFCCYKVFV